MLDKAREAIVHGSVGVALFNRDNEPKNSIFYQDGSDGAWIDDGGNTPVLIEQVSGSSSVYLIETDIVTGTVLRDQRPWQMLV